MAKTLGQIERQITKLQREAEAIRKREISGVVERIKAAVEHYGLTAQDVFGARAANGSRGQTSTKPARKAASAKTPRLSSSSKGQPAPVKYRDGNGNTWAARGSQPKWLVEASKSGRKLEDFAVKPE